MGEKLMTVKEFAKEHHISQQGVYAKICRKSNEMRNCIYRKNGKMFLNQKAQELLMPTDGNIQLINKAIKLKESFEDEKTAFERQCKIARRLEDESTEKDDKIASLEKEISADKAQIKELEKKVKELTERSLAISELSERLNVLMDVLEESANSGVGKKIGNILAGKNSMR